MTKPRPADHVRLIDLTVGDLLAIVREELGARRGEELLKPQEIAKLTGTHVQTVRGWLRSGLQFQKAGSRKLVRRADLDAWLHRDKSKAHLRLLGGR